MGLIYINSLVYTTANTKSGAIMFVKKLHGYINSKYILSVDIDFNFSGEGRLYAVFFLDTRGDYHQVTEFDSKERAFSEMVGFIDYLNSD